MPPGRCRCKYCNTGRGKFSQRQLTKHFTDGYKAALNEKKKQEYLAAKEKRLYIPDDEPLVKIFLKTAPGSRQVLKVSNSHYKCHSHQT